MDSVLRPRDIQARIRSGESPEAVAAAAQTSVDKIMGFATPVLAERAYVAEQALKASVRRRAGDGPIGHLGEAVEHRLAGEDVDPAQLSWDAWRREDGRWTLVADYPDGGPRAQFVYDAAGRYVVAEDDEARRLVGERSATPSVPEPETVEAEQDESHALEAVEVGTTTDDTVDTDDTEDTEQLPLGDDAIGLITGVRPSAGPAPAADDWMQTQASERAHPASQPAPEPRRAVDEPAATLFDPPAPEESSPATGHVVDPGQTGTTAAEPQQDESAEQPEQPAKPRKSSKSKRASVPSWDEIMFGSGKGE